MEFYRRAFPGNATSTSSLSTSLSSRRRTPITQLNKPRTSFKVASSLPPQAPGFESPILDRLRELGYGSLSPADRRQSFRSCLVGLSIFLQSIDSLLLQNFQSNTWQVKKGAVGEKCGENNLAAKSNKLPGFEPETLRSSFDVVVDFLGGKTQGCVAQTKKWQTNVE